MSQYLEFIANHWILWTALVVIVLLMVGSELMAKMSGILQLSPQDLTQMVNRDNALVIDIRDEEVFAKGHIAKAVNVPLKDIANIEEKLKSFQENPIIVVCAHGQRAQAAAMMLKRKGATAHVLKGGVAAWRQEKLPLVKN